MEVLETGSAVLESKEESDTVSNGYISFQRGRCTQFGCTHSDEGTTSSRPLEASVA